MHAQNAHFFRSCIFVLRQTELQAWLTRHESDLPLAGADKDDDKQKLLSYTGSVPYFLFQFLSIAIAQKRGCAASASAGLAKPAPEFDSCWEEFVQFPPLRQISEHLRKSLGALIDLKQSKPATFDSVRSFMISCIADGAVGHRRTTIAATSGVSLVSATASTASCATRWAWYCTSCISTRSG